MLYFFTVLKSMFFFSIFPVGLAVVLLDVPFDIMGIKLLWWTWHDTDPNIYDRHYWVPWTSYYFHAAFASSFMFLFHGTRRLLCNSPGYKADRWVLEILCAGKFIIMPIQKEDVGPQSEIFIRFLFWYNSVYEKY